MYDKPSTWRYFTVKFLNAASSLDSAAKSFLLTFTENRNFDAQRKHLIWNICAEKSYEFDFRRKALSFLRFSPPKNEKFNFSPFSPRLRFSHRDERKSVAEALASGPQNPAGKFSYT